MSDTAFSMHICPHGNLLCRDKLVPIDILHISPTTGATPHELVRVRCNNCRADEALRAAGEKKT